MYLYAKIILFSDNNDAKPNNVESAIASGSNAGDPYAASVSAALSSMNINAGLVEALKYWRSYASILTKFYVFNDKVMVKNR